MAWTRSPEPEATPQRWRSGEMCLGEEVFDVHADGSGGPASSDSELRRTGCAMAQRRCRVSALGSGREGEVAATPVVYSAESFGAPCGSQAACMVPRAGLFCVALAVKEVLRRAQGLQREAAVQRCRLLWVCTDAKNVAAGASARVAVRQRMLAASNGDLGARAWKAGGRFASFGHWPHCDERYSPTR